MTTTERSGAGAGEVSTADREIVQSRTYDAPRELVFSVWTSPEHVREWWGPRGFTTTTKRMDVRPDGVWEFVMHGPDRDFPNRIRFLEVVPPERLVYRHTGDEDTADISFHVTVTFEERDGGTHLTMRSLFETAAERARVVEEYGAIEGGRQTLERLGEHLASLQRRSGGDPRVASSGASAGRGRNASASNLP